MAFTPCQDALTMEVVTFVTGESCDLHILFERLHADGALLASLMQERIVFAFIESELIHRFLQALLQSDLVHDIHA